MATEEQLRKALLKAHRAKDFEAAELFARDIKNLRKKQTTDDTWVSTGEESIPQRKSEIPKDKADPTLGEQIIGAGETALSVVTGATGGAIGSIVGTLQGIAKELKSGKFGTDKAANRVQRLADDYAAQLTYEPKTKQGKEFLKYTAETLTPLEALTPLQGTTKVLNRVNPEKTQKPLTPTEEALSQATDLNIPVLTTDIQKPNTFVRKSVQGIGENIPVVGTGNLRAKQQQKRIKSIQDIVNEYGTDEFYNITNRIMESLSKKRQENIRKYDGMKKEVINRLDKGFVPIEKTKKLIDSEIQRLSEMRTPSADTVASDLSKLKKEGFFDNRNLTGIENIRKELSTMYDSPDLVNFKKLHSGVTRKIYKSLNDDMGEYIENTGGRRDFTKWKVANKKLSHSIDELQSTTLKNVLKKGDIKPEDVNRLLFSKAPSEIKLLYKNLDVAGKKHAKIAILNQAANKAGGLDKISPAKFNTELDKLSNQVGIFFRPEEKDILQGLSKALSITKRADEFAANPPTGRQLTLPVGGMVLTDILGGFVGGMVGGVTLGSALRAYETVPVRRALRKINKAKKGTKQFELATEALLTAIYTLDKEEDDER